MKADSFSLAVIMLPPDPCIEIFNSFKCVLNCVGKRDKLVISLLHS